VRLQLTAAAAGALVVVVTLVGGGLRAARADDRIETKTTLMIEPGSGVEELRILHPQLDLGLDLGRSLELSAGYEADIVSGATPRVYDVSLDAVSSATKFADVRHSFRGGFAYQSGDTNLSASYSYGFEEDYKSHAFSVGMVTELNGKNTTLGLRYGHNFDKVCDADNSDREPLERRALDESTGCFGGGGTEPTVTHDIGIDHYEATLTQNLSPVALVQFGLDGQVIRGFQSNPYRRVRVYDLQVQEVTPETRERIAAFLRFNYALPGLSAAINVMARFYADSWAIESGTLDVTYHQYLGRHLLVSLRGRVYQQDNAVFFRDAEDYARSGPVGQFWTGDRELSPFRDFLVGAKIALINTAEGDSKAWGWFDDTELTVKGDLLFYDALTPNPPNPNRNSSLIDGIILQAGLRLHW
jgi:Protein of unknown function (DUF3570)